MIIDPEPPAETILHATRLHIRCGTVEITSNGVGHGKLTVDGVELPHSSVTFTSKAGSVDELLIRVKPRQLAEFTQTVATLSRGSPVVKHEPAPAPSPETA